MKRFISILIVLSAFSVLAFPQAKKPVIMVVPSDSWCIRNGFVTEFQNLGQTQQIPDYGTAFRQNDEIRTIISAMSEFMAANEFPLQSLEAELNRINNESVEMSLMQGKSGSVIEESPVEALRRTAKADIILNLDYKVTMVGPRRQIEFNLQAIDAYSSKIISGNTGTSSPVSSATPMTTILEEAVLSFKDNFLAGLQRHFDDLFANGREISVTLLRYDSSPVDFDSEFEFEGDMYELAEHIDLWFSNNTVEGRYSLNDKSANRMRFSQVRIPLYDTVMGKERAADAQSFGNKLARMLRKEPYNLVVGVTPKGLGEVWITIGDK